MVETARELSDVPAHPHQRRNRPNLGVVAAALLFAGVVLITAICAHRSTRLEDDEGKFNLPAIRQFAHQLPWPDLSDYSMATTPGYHLVMAVVAGVFGEHLLLLRACGAVFGVLLIATVAAAIGGRVALVLPLIFSAYVVTSAGWLLPEDAAWWLVALILLMAMDWKIDVRFFIACAVALAALIFTRQSTVWMILPMAAAAYAGESDWPMPRRAAGVVLAAAPAIAILAIFVHLWHGLTPPAFQMSASADNPALTRYGGISGGSALMTLAMLGLFGTPLMPWFWRGRASGKWIILGGAAGLVIGLLCESMPMFPTRRSGIWSFAGHAPIVHDRSTLIIALAVLGGAVAAMAIAALPRRAAWVLGALLAGFVGVQMSNPYLWQRYYEPFALLWLIFAVHAVWPRSPRLLQTAGLWALNALQFAAFVYFVCFSAVR